MADFLTRRGNRYYFQRAVPLNLQTRIGKKLWRTSLGDCSYKDAKRRARPFIDETDTLIERFARLSPARLNAISSQLADLGFPTFADDLTPENAAQALSEGRSKAIGALCRELWTMSKPLEPVLDHEDMFSVLANGAPSTSLRPLAARAVALSTALQTIPSELRGEAPTKAPSCAPLESLHARWAERTQATPQTAGEALTTVRRFTELHGTLALREITREHCREFRAAMLRMPRILSEEMRKTPLPDILKQVKDTPYDRINPVTARKRLSFLKTILAFGAEEGDFDESPASGLTIKAGVETEDRKPFSPDDLESLFASLNRRVERDSFYWITVLLLATGARAGEIIPLETRDIDLDGQPPHIRIVPDATSGRRLKTKHSERSIPLHPALLQLGFAEFIESKEGRLFPELKADKRGKFSTYFSQLWMRWLRTKVGITDKSKTLHSLRHSFKSLARRAGIPEDVHDAITGHSPATVGRGYGDYPIETLAQELQKIVLPQSLMSSIEHR